MAKQLPVGDVVLDLRPLNRILDNLEKRAERLVEDVGEGVVTDTKGGAPVRTGRLRASYNMQRVDRLTRRVGTNTEYAQHVEFGTSTQAAQPHFLPALERGRQRIEREAGQLFRP
jgi:HK97 gp10 family phage protein